MQQGMCPLPPSALIENQPFYNELFDFGVETGSPHDETYVRYNFVQFMPIQKMMLDRYREDQPVPMYARQKDLRFNNNLGAYEYAMCSWRCMYEAIANNNQRYMLSHIASGRGIRLNFYGDFDMSVGDMHEESVSLGKNVSDAVREVYECIRILVREQQALANPEFADIEPEPLASLLYAHREGKQSSHMVFFLMLKPAARSPDKAPYKMFADVEDCRYFYYNVLLISAKRHASKAENPLYFRKKSDGLYMCILDPKVYRVNGLMRMIMCMKRDGRDIGRLTPDCGSQGLVCDHSETCTYHRPKPAISMQEFCANEMRFVPRKKNGNPMDVDLLHIARVDNPDLKGSTRKAGDASLSMLSMQEYEWADTPVQKSKGPRMGMFASAGKTAVMDHIAHMLQQLTGFKCTFAGTLSMEGEMGLIASESLECLYKGKRLHPSYTVDDVKPEKHTTNHIFYNAVIDLPLPWVLINCTSPSCEPYIANLKSPVGQLACNFRRLHVDFTPLPAKTKDTYVKLVHEYFKTCNYTI